MEIVSPHKTPTRSEITLIIKELVSKGALAWSKHSKERMIERGITIPQILNCLAKGTVAEGPFLSHRSGGGYEVALEKGTAGEWLRVVVCVKFNEKLLIVTVY